MADREYIDMRISGILAWVHRFVMLVSYPFRNFWKTTVGVLAVLAVLIVVPMCYGIKFHDIWSWYKAKMPFHEFVSIKHKTVDAVNEKIDAAKEIAGVQDEKEKKTEKPTKHYPVWKVEGVNEGKYESKKGIPPQAGMRVYVQEQVSDAVSDTAGAAPEGEKVETPKVVPEYHPYVKKKKSGEDEARAEKTADEPKIAPQDRDLSSYYKVLENKNLEYLKEPQIYSGMATVVGSNSLYVADTFVYLYGVYSDPKIHDLEQAQSYLVMATENKDVDCHVIAYTRQTQTATALCFADGTLLNKELVDKYLADNVALK